MFDQEKEMNEMVLSCNTEGMIKSILYPKSEFSELFRVGDFFLKNVDSGSLTKALTFFTELKNAKMIVNYEINYTYNQHVTTLILSGAHDNEDIIVLVASRQIDFLAFEEIMGINSDQVNIFRTAMKQRAKEEDPKESHEFKYFDEISRLNNELMNVQRELAKKNNDLRVLNARLEELTIRDSLTNLFNKRYLYTKFKEEVTRSARFQYPIAMAMIDLNDFKQINDVQGHDEGDRVLRKFAELAALHTRNGLDYVFRIGGDEFLILLTHADDATAETILNRIDTEYRKACSLSSLAFGISSFIGNLDQSLDDILKEVDIKMYRHKNEIKSKRL